MTETALYPAMGANFRHFPAARYFNNATVAALTAAGFDTAESIVTPPESAVRTRLRQQFDLLGIFRAHAQMFRDRKMSNPIRWDPIIEVEVRAFRKDPMLSSFRHWV